MRGGVVVIFVFLGVAGVVSLITFFFDEVFIALLMMRRDASGVMKREEWGGKGCLSRPAMLRFLDSYDQT